MKFSKFIENMKFSQYIENNELSFHSPITQEEWGRITDDALERTEEITFQTPSGKEVPFRKVKYGEWVGNSFDFYCSNCKQYQNFYAGKSNFCPHCGADMRESK